MLVRKWLVGMVALFVLSAAGQSAAEPLYRVTDLGDLPGGANYSAAVGINNRGQVVGISSVADGVHGFLWTNGVMRDLGVLYADHRYNYATGLNDSGQVVGRSVVDLGHPDSQRPFLYSGGVMSPLGGFGDGYGDANKINNQGTVAGISRHPDGATRATLWANGTMTDLGSLGGYGYSDAYDINERNQVVGVASVTPGVERGFIWQNDTMTMTDLGDLWNGSGRARAYAISDLGQVIGETWLSNPAEAHGFLWENGGMTDLGHLPGTTGPASQALGINNLGQVVGVASPGVPFIWDRVNGMRNLEDLVDGSAAGWDLRQAWGINDKGQIAGFGIDPQGNQHGILLTPIPEPSTLLLWSSLGAMGLLALWRRRKRTA